MTGILSVEKGGTSSSDYQTYFTAAENDGVEMGVNTDEVIAIVKTVNLSEMAGNLDLSSSKITGLLPASKGGFSYSQFEA